MELNGKSLVVLTTLEKNINGANISKSLAWLETTKGKWDKMLLFGWIDPLNSQVNALYCYILCSSVNL